MSEIRHRSGAGLEYDERHVVDVEKEEWIGACPRMLTSAVAVRVLRAGLSSGTVARLLLLLISVASALNGRDMIIRSSPLSLRQPFTADLYSARRGHMGASFWFVDDARMTS